MSTYKFIIAFLLSFFALAPRLAYADDPVPILENPLTVKAVKLSPYNVGAGAQGELQIDFSLADHHKAYVDAFKLKSESAEAIKIDKLRLSPTFEFEDSFSHRKREAVHNDAMLKAVVEIPSGLKPGEQEVTFKLTYQACTPDHCLFPKTIPVQARINFTSGSVGPKDPPARMESAPAAIEAGGNGAFDQAIKHGLLSAFIFVFIAGVLTSLTPCVYPLLPITLAVIGARSKEQTRLKSFSLSVSYVLGIAFTYSALGVMAASTGSLFGSALSNIYIVTAIALLFVVMGLSMYGMFEIQAPAFIRNRLGSTKTGTGYKGAFLTGLISGLVASPCIGPVLVAILAWIAQTGSRGLGFGLLFTFAMGMGILLILVGTFSHLLGQLPKSGPWMDVVKFVFGTTMIGMAFFYIQPLYPQWLFHGLAALALILISSAYGAWEHNAQLSQVGRLRKGMMLSIFAIGLLLAASSTIVKLGLQVPMGFTHEASRADKKLSWNHYSEEAIAQAARDGKPVLIDFYAEWCAACKEFEHETFPDPQVEKTLREKFVLLQFDATEDSPEFQKLKAKYKIAGLPTLVFFDGKGKRRDDMVVTGFQKPDVFHGTLQKVLQ